MVAILIRLKLSLLRNGLRRSVWRTVGFVIGMLYALILVAAVDVGLIALRFASVELAADVTVLSFSVLSLGWLLMSLLVFGVDETLDPARFALLPVRARALLPGLLIAALIGSPGIATILVSSALVVTWARGLLPLVAAVVAVLLGVVTCVLLSRAATAAFASFLGSRRYRDVVFVGLATLGIVIAVGSNLLSGLGRLGPEQLREFLADAATVSSWTPFGWAWAIPADAARGQWPYAVAHLLLALALVAVLWRAWEHFLAARLTEPLEKISGGGQVRAGGLVERLYPPTPAGGVAVRTLRYWRRDPRYLAGIVGFAVAPVILIVLPIINPEAGSSVLALGAPVLLAWLLGVSMAQDLSYDGSAVWLHVATGVAGAADRAGRVMSILTIFGPLLVAMVGVAGLVTGEWRLLPAVAGLSIGLMLAGLGVGCVVGVLWQWPAPPPGANPFTKGSSGGLPALASFSVSSGLTLLILLPTAALAVGSWWIGWLSYLALLVGVASGVAVLLLGIRRGGALLDRRWPEVLGAVSDR